jgi:hypothetical protein
MNRAYAVITGGFVIAAGSFNVCRSLQRRAPRPI